jgi:phosphatidate phosphatase APP1
MEGSKYKKIIHLLETYPEMPFILIGDASEEDIDIYVHIAKNYPDRILAIYIRTVKRKSRMKRVESLIQEYTDIDVVLMTDGKKAIAHAQSMGFIK